MVLLPIDKPEDGSGSITANVRPPLLLLPPRIPYVSMGLSLLLHALLLLILTSVPFRGRAKPLIDLEHEKVTFYDLSEGFPDISALLKEPPSVKPEHGNSPQPGLTPQARSESNVAIDLKQADPGPQLLEQPDLPRVDKLPRLELPNILLTRAKMEPGKEPVSLSQEPKPQMTEVLPVARPELKIQDPGPMPEPPSMEDIRLRSPVVTLARNSDLNLPPPVEPPKVKPSFPSRVSLPAPPPMDDPKIKGQIVQLPSPTAATALIYSADPTLPRGELRIPRVSASGSINASPEGGTGKGAGTGTPEFGNASIAISGVSIKNRVPVIPAANDVAVVQAPRPPQPVELPKQQPRPELTIPKTPVPPLQKALKIPSLNETTTSPEESPLREMERQGKEIYTTSINAPNFTSKRGSWIFRFAELPELSSLAGPGSGTHENGVQEGRLTAPIATVKVDPRYPPEVIRERVEGVVVLYAVLRKDGTVDPESVRLVRKLDSRLELSAREALVAWKFRPSQKNGHPIDIQAEITIPFYFRKDPLYP